MFSEIDSRFIVDEIIIEYGDKDSQISKTKGVSLNYTLTLGFSQDEGVGLVQDSSIAKEFEVHERDSHDDRPMMTLHSSMPYHELCIPRSIRSCMEL